MDFEELYPNRFIQSSDLKGKDVTLVIGAVEKEELDGMKGKQWKAILTFVGAKKQFVANRSNGEAMKLMFGRETTDWVGKRVTLYPTETEVAGEVVPCIRVRGSPDISQPLSNVVQRGKKKLTIKVIPTAVGKKGAAPASNGKAANPPSSAPATPAPAASAVAPVQAPVQPAPASGEPPDDLPLPTLDGGRATATAAAPAGEVDPLEVEL